MGIDEFYVVLEYFIASMNLLFIVWQRHLGSFKILVILLFRADISCGLLDSVTDESIRKSGTKCLILSFPLSLLISSFLPKRGI